MGSGHRKTRGVHGTHFACLRTHGWGPGWRFVPTSRARGWVEFYGRLGERHNAPHNANAPISFKIITPAEVAIGSIAERFHGATPGSWPEMAETLSKSAAHAHDIWRFFKGRLLLAPDFWRRQRPAPRSFLGVFINKIRGLHYMRWL